MKWLSFSVDGHVLENFTKNHFSSIRENIYEFKSSVKCFYSIYKNFRDIFFLLNDSLI